MCDHKPINQYNFIQQTMNICVGMFWLSCEVVDNEVVLPQFHYTKMTMAAVCALHLGAPTLRTATGGDAFLAGKQVPSLATALHQSLGIGVGDYGRWVRRMGIARTAT